MKPAETTILDIIEDRLRNNISVANGYSEPFRKVTRGQIGGFKSHEYPVVNFWPVRHNISQNEYGLDEHELNILMDARVISREGNFPDKAATLIAETYAGIVRTTSNPQIDDDIDATLDSTVEEVLLVDAGYQIGAGDSPWCGAAIEIQVRYTSPPGDLFTINTP